MRLALPDLLLTRTLVDALRRRSGAVEEETDRAVEPESRRPRAAPETTVWETLNEHQRQAVVTLLARLIAKAAVGAARQESDHDRER